jgi:hypothetical protein
MRSNVKPSSAVRRAMAWPGSLCAVAVLLSACGSGGDADPPPPVVPAVVAVSGVVADGPLKDATVCYDLNDNGACDSGEPSAVTDADGKYRFDIDESAAGQHSVLASVPATSIDKDTGLPVGVAFQLKSPATGTAGAQAVFVSPLTTVVANIIEDSGKTLAEAVAQVQDTLGLSASPMTDFTATGAAADVGLAARVVGTVIIETSKLAVDGNVAAGPTAQLIREATTSQLAFLAAALAASTAETPEAKAAEAAAALASQLNLSAATVSAVAEQLVKPTGTAEAPGPFVNVRRFAYTDANNYSYTLFTGDNSQLDADGKFTANEVRNTVSAGVNLPFNRNQMYWTGTEWKTCELQWQVITGIKAGTATTPQTSAYCGASRNESKIATEDIAGKTLREIVTKIRAYPLADSVGPHTDPVSGLPVNWGPSPDLLPADAVFPAGAAMSSRSTRSDIGGTDRIELAGKSSVRWSDGVYRQATRLEQYSGMPGNLADAAVVPGNGNTVFVADVTLAEQADATLEKFKRWRAGFDVAALKIRFYQCDVRKADQAALNCASAGDGTLAITTQGGIRLMRVASGYPAALTTRLGQERFWAETGGNVLRGARDLERTRYDQRINGVAWNTLRTALGIPAHTEPVAPVTAGPFSLLRSFSFTDAANYSLRIFSGDSSLRDSNGDITVDEQRKTLAAGVEQPFVRNRSFWTGTDWYDCPNDGAQVLLVASQAPNRSIYCKGYVDERVGNVVQTLGGRLMNEVVNEIRAYGSTDNGTSFGGWGPSPNAHPQLASTRFPAGSTMEYRGVQPIATPVAIATSAADQVRVAPGPTSSAAFNTWAFASGLDQMIALYPGNLAGTVLNGNTTLFVWSYTAPPSDPAYTDRVEIRVAFDANGNKARFTQNNRLVSNGSSTNYITLLDTTYTVETLGNVKVLRFAAMPAGFEDRFRFQRMFAERNGGVWYAFKDTVSAEPQWSIRLNSTATSALFESLGVTR